FVMAFRKYKAVMRIRPKEYNKVADKADEVADSLETNVAKYPNPNPTIAEIRAQLLIVRNLIAKVNEGDRTQIGLRDESVNLLYQMLLNELIYVNIIGNNDRGILMLSGFEVTDEPNPQPVPDQVVIKRIVDGDIADSAKIFIVSLHLKNLIYYVEMTDTPELPASWKNILSTLNSRKLIINNLISGEKHYFRVRASNASGIGSWSQPVPFISQR
ncbi:MAG: fibronectin type III domain-containing protein, partial [Bacteroidales bacterium]|nr:fibronectin type III domain-containing protein [Bacteroidales bacterium]